MGADVAGIARRLVNEFGIEGQKGATNTSKGECESGHRAVSGDEQVSIVGGSLTQRGVITMHMFRLEYVTNHANGVVESGKVIVCADSHDQALDVICVQLDLPPSRTRILQSIKVKPACYT